MSLDFWPDSADLDSLKFDAAIFRKLFVDYTMLQAPHCSLPMFVIDKIIIIVIFSIKIIIMFWIYHLFYLKVLINFYNT